MTDLLGYDSPLTDLPLQTGDALPQGHTHTGVISLAGRPYVMDPTRGFVRETLDMRRASQDQGAQPGQQTLTDAGQWHRWQIDFTLGAGQPHFDRPESSDRRFHTSKGVYPWTPGELSLQNDTTLVSAVTSGNVPVLSVGGYVYWLDGVNLRRCPNPYDAVPTVSTIAFAEAVRSITTDGAYVYCLFANGIQRTVVGSAAALAWSDFGGDLIGYANGRLIAANGPRLVEVDAAGDAGGDGVLDYTHSNESFRWTSITSAPNAIYAAGYAGDRSLVYAVSINTNTGGLRVPTFACALPDGEVVNALCEYGGIVTLGTSRGVRAAQITGNAALSMGPVIEVGGGVFCFEPQGEYIWFGWSNYDHESTGLGRLALAELTAPLVPAYATDLMATTQGRVVGVATHSDRRCFAVAGVGLYAESDELVAAGTLDGGQIGWSTFALKTAAAFDVRHKPLTGIVTCQVLLEDGTVTAAGESAYQSSVGPSRPFELDGVHGEVVSPVVTLTRADETHGPVLRRWTLSAVVRPQRQDRYVLPLWFKAMVKDRDDVPHTMDTVRELAILKSIEATGQVIWQQIGTEIKRVQIDKIVQAEQDDWNDERTGMQGIVLVHTITQEAGI